MTYSHFPFLSKPWSCALCIHEQITLLFNKNLLHNCFCNFWHSYLDTVVLHSKTMSSCTYMINCGFNWSWLYYFPQALIALTDSSNWILIRKLYSHLFNAITENCFGTYLQLFKCHIPCYNHDSCDKTQLWYLTFSISDSHWQAPSCSRCQTTKCVCFRRLCRHRRQPTTMYSSGMRYTKRLHPTVSKTSSRTNDTIKDWIGKPLSLLSLTYKCVYIIVT